MNINEFITVMESSSDITVTEEEMKRYQNFVLKVARDVVFTEKNKKYIEKTIHQSAKEVFGGYIEHDCIVVFDCEQDDRIAIGSLLDDIVSEAKKRDPQMFERVSASTGDGDEGCIYLKPKKTTTKSKIGKAIASDISLLAWVAALPLICVAGIVYTPFKIAGDIKQDIVDARDNKIRLSRLDEYEIKSQSQITELMKASSLSYIKKAKPGKDERIVVWSMKGKEYVALVSVKYDIDKYIYIAATQINPKFKGRGLEDQLIKFCVNSLNASAVAISPKEKGLIELYKKHGFKINEAWSNSKYNNNKKIIMTTY